ncbi:MAG: lipoprotein [Flavobacteriales bacterium]|jgi:hypothetical protein
MKRIIFSLVALAILSSCAVKMSFTKALKEEYNLTDQSMKDVQFFVSSEIILERSSSKGSSGTTQDGTIVSTSSKEQNRIIILPRTKCVLEETADNGAVLIRFETGAGKYITFATRPNMDAGKYYFQADWKQGKGGEIDYGDDEKYFATSSSGEAYLMVKVKKSNRTKRKDRVVKGMKV